MHLKLTRKKDPKIATCNHMQSYFFRLSVTAIDGNSRNLAECAQKSSRSTVLPGAYMQGFKTIEVRLTFVIRTGMLLVGFDTG